MAAAPPQQTALPGLLVEEKHFRLSLERAEPLLREAIEHALGVRLEVLAHGMWYARRETGRFGYQEITVRALPTEEGTSVEVRIQDHWTPTATTLFIAGIIAGSILVVPLFFLIAKSQADQNEKARGRLVALHKVWTEVASAIGAPLKAGYRGRPEQARVRVDRHEEAERAEELEGAAEEEAAEAERPPERAARRPRDGSE